jgi:hypothetical protein
MSLNLPDLTAFFVVFFGVAAIAVVLAVGTLVSLFARNHTARVTRHEGVFQYYGHLVLGH